MAPDSLSPSFSQSQILPSCNKSFPVFSKPQYSFPFFFFSFSLFTPSVAYFYCLWPLGLLYSCLRLCPLGGCFPHGYLNHLKLGLTTQPSWPAQRLNDVVVERKRRRVSGEGGVVGVRVESGPQAPKSRNAKVTSPAKRWGRRRWKKEQTPAVGTKWQTLSPAYCYRAWSPESVSL